MMKWAKILFPINRSITGEGLRKTIQFIKKNVNNNFKNYRIKSNTKVFDWKIPLEWKITEAFIKEVGGKKICDFKDNNLHVLGYSKKINKLLNFDELRKNVFYSKHIPNAIPYFTSYYKKNWGFCVPYNKFKKMNKKSKYQVKINSEHFKGGLDYTELLIRGKSKKEILIISYICHPSMANNELSGPLVIMALSKILKPGKYSIRLVLIPETIGAIAYIKKNINNLRNNLIAGFNLSCVGDKGPFTLISSKEGNTYADKVAKRILSKTKKFKIKTFLKRGSNERQFGCQNLNLPFREAHHITGQIVLIAETKKCDLCDLDLGEMQEVDDRITEDIYSVLSVHQSVASRSSYGGTAPSQVRRQINRWRGILDL